MDMDREGVITDEKYKIYFLDLSYSNLVEGLFL